MKKFLLTLFLVTLLVGCSNTPNKATNSQGDEDILKVDYEVYEDIEKNVDSHSWYSFREDLPIEKKDKWFKTKVKDDKTYIIVSAGEQSHGGYHLEISDVIESKNTITINAKLVNKNEGTDAFHTPISVVVIDDNDFDKEIEVRWI